MRDNFDINITMTRDGKMYSLVKSRRRDCRGCFFYGKFHDRCPRIGPSTLFLAESIYPCNRLGRNFVWKEVK